MSLLSTESKLITMPVLPNTMRTITEAYAPLIKASLQVLFHFCWLGLLVLLSPTFCSRLCTFLLVCIPLVVFLVLQCCICCIALLHLLPLPLFLFLCIPASSVSLFSINNRPRLGNLKATVAVEENCLSFLCSIISELSIVQNSCADLYWSRTNTHIPKEWDVFHQGWTFQVLSLIESQIFEISSKWTGCMDPTTRPLRDPGIFAKSRSRDSQKSDPGIFWDFQKPLKDCIHRLSTPLIDHNNLFWDLQSLQDQK